MKWQAKAPAPTNGHWSDLMLTKEIQHLRPGVFGGRFVIRRPVIRVEAMLRRGIDHDLARLVRGCQRGAHLIHPFERDAGIFSAIEADHRGLEFSGNLDGVSRLARACGPREPSVPCGPGLQV